MKTAHIQPKEIKVKDADVLIGLMERRFAPLLIKIIVYMANRWGLVMTESYREKRHMNDLHGCQPVRAVDLRSWCYGSESAARLIADEINSMWSYDPTRPRLKVALLHKVSGGAYHFHIQVSDKTIRRGYA